ncbi:MAG: hypothetical protein PHP13_06580, partial [Methanomicrobium sp.]|nr:hypothetical protein [Methanomicrobium sp.]
MRKILGLMIIAVSALFIFAGCASALSDANVISYSDKDWIVAGGEASTITLLVTDSSVSVSQVEFYCTESALYGDVAVKFDSSSPYETSFSSIKSGTAVISANIHYTDGEGNPGLYVREIPQKIDHAAPHKTSAVIYSNEVTVNEVTLFTVQMADKYGNLIDSRYESEKGLTREYVELYCSPADSLLWDGADYTLNYAKVYVDNSGSASINYKVSKTPGTNVMTIDAPFPIPSDYRHIEGIANAVPFDIFAGVNPDNAETPYLPADDESKFYITYYLTDLYGNPAGNRTIYISTSNPHDTPFYRTSDEDGQVKISYGPTPQKSVITLTAYSVDNESVSVETRVMFESTDPVDMLLTANPQLMPSHDVAPDRTSAIRAKVIDIRGNPVANEMVEFTIEHDLYPLYQTQAPFLSSASATTNENG